MTMKNIEAKEDNVNNAIWWATFAGANMISITLMALLMI